MMKVMSYKEEEIDDLAHDGDALDKTDWDAEKWDKTNGKKRLYIKKYIMLGFTTTGSDPQQPLFLF